MSLPVLSPFTKRDIIFYYFNIRSCPTHARLFMWLGERTARAGGSLDFQRSHCGSHLFSEKEPTLWGTWHWLSFLTSRRTIHSRAISQWPFPILQYMWKWKLQVKSTWHCTHQGYLPNQWWGCNITLYILYYICPVSSKNTDSLFHLIVLPVKINHECTFSWCICCFNFCMWRKMDPNWDC